MTKNITFFRQSGTRKWLETMPVDLEALSPMARFLAMSISTTDNSDDFSAVTLDCRYCNRELWQRVIADKTNRYDAWTHHACEENLAGDARDPFFGDIRHSVRFIWDSLKNNGETPEQYFERQAGYIQREASPYLLDSVLRGYEDGAEYQIMGSVPPKIYFLRKRGGITQKALAAAAGINIRQIQKLESGEIRAENLTLKNALALAAALGVEPKDLI